MTNITAKLIFKYCGKYFSTIRSSSQTFFTFKQRSLIRLLSVLRCLKFQQIHIVILKIKMTISQAYNKVFRLYVIIRRLYFTINNVTEENH